MSGDICLLHTLPEEVVRKVKSAVTDTSRIKATDPGHPEVCVVNKYHQTFTPGEYDNICEMCRKGAIGCVACKKILAESLNTLLDPFREKRAYYEAHRDEVRDIIKTGTEKACRIGEETVDKVKEAMFLKV